MNAYAEPFLGALGGRFTFQTFDDHKAPRKLRDPLAKWMHGTLAEHADMLADLNARGAGVFVMVNEGDGKGRKATNVQRVRAYFADFDGTQPPDVATVPLRPHAIIESSPGRWHWYWFIDGAPLAMFGAVQSAIAERFGSDPSMKDLPRVLRLPGFLHQKHEPFLTRIVELRDAPRYTHTDFVQVFGIDLSAPVQLSRGNRPAVARDVTVTALPTAQRHRRTLPATIPEGERNATLLSLAGGLVRKGHNLLAVTRRLQRINAERCEPPLCASEVDTIAMRAIGYGSQGFAMLPHKLLDAPEWMALPPPVHDIVLTAFRRYDGANNGNIALTWDDFEGRPGFMRKQTFYGHRRKAIASGILQPHEGHNTQRGKRPDLFAIAPDWLPSPVSLLKPCASVENVHRYIDKQGVGVCVFAGGKRARNGGHR
jgi:hypothetical protein